MNNAKKQRYYLVYQITNKLNNMIYIGIHVTNNINDNYMGSGRRIKQTIKEYGLENFEKIILYKFDNKDDMFRKEAELVNKEFIANENTYNVIIGGQFDGKFNTIDTVPIITPDGEIMRVHKTDPKYLSGEYKYVHTGYTSVFDKNGNYHRIKTNDPAYINGEYTYIKAGFIPVYDSDGCYKLVSVKNEKYISGEYQSIFKHRILSRDKNNNYFNVLDTDNRLKTGELIPHFKGCNHTDESKKKIGAKTSIAQKGEKNSQFDTCWITNEKLKINKKIKKIDTLPQDWKYGRKFYKNS